MLGLLAAALAIAGALAFATDVSGARQPTAVQLVTRDAIVASGRWFELELRCPGSARSCDGRVTVREPGKRILARGPASLSPGIATTVRMKLTKKAFKRVRRKGPLAARVVMRGRDATGRRLKLRDSVTIGVPVREKPSLLLGVADDLIQGAPVQTAQVIRDLGLGAVRMLFHWRPGQSTLGPVQTAILAGVVGAAPDLRVLVTTRAQASSDAPSSASERSAYCSFLGDIAARFPEIKDFGIWLEPNKQRFWAPQFDASGASVAPRSYVKLLSHCWDVLHGIRADVNVIGPSTASKGNDRPNARSNISHAPGTFIRLMGDAYRTSGRTAPILDTIGHHPYGEHSAERPWVEHRRSSTIGMGDWAELMQALHDAFAGTGQPMPGSGTVRIWYVENGYQTVPSKAKAGLYTGAENDPHPLPARVAAHDLDPHVSPAPDQTTQLNDAVRLAYCQSYVTALFDFLLYDEAPLSRWQSGLFWTDRTPKGSAAAYADQARAANARKIPCSRLKGGPAQRAFVPRTAVDVTRVGWVKATRFNHKHDLWRAQVAVDEKSRYVATIVPVRRRGTSARAAGQAAHTVKGTLRKGFYHWVAFPRQRLRPGLYRIEMTVTSRVNAARRATLDGPVFRVLAKRR